MICKDCHHLVLLDYIDRGIEDPPDEYGCGHFESVELDSNRPARWIGFNPIITPEWCPLVVWDELTKKPNEGPDMHYMIHKWLPEELTYKIVHYTHDFEDMQRMMIEYPESQGYIHSIDIKWIKSHDMVLKVVEARDQIKAIEAKQAEAIKERIAAFKASLTTKGS